MRGVSNKHCLLTFFIAMNFLFVFGGFFCYQVFVVIVVNLLSYMNHCIFIDSLNSGC